jgi:uncharacterized GH25 family protein
VAELRLVRFMTAVQLISPLVLLSLASCAQHYRGTVVNRHGHPVPYARVEGHGMHHAFPLGEGPFVQNTVADAAGRFDLVSEDWPSEIVATSPDSKHRGRVWLPASDPPYVIVIR